MTTSDPGTPEAGPMEDGPVEDDPVEAGPVGDEAAGPAAVAESGPFEPEPAHTVAAGAPRTASRATVSWPTSPSLPRPEAPADSVTAVTTPSPHVILTYDDGPEPVATDAVLGALAEAGATATFFVLLTRVRRHPALFAEVQAAGHEIALHGPDHRRLSTVPIDRVRSRTADAKAELEDRIGREVRWFRPPYGTQTPAIWSEVRAAGVEPVLWSAVLRDWEDIPHADRLTAATTDLRSGAIVLGHDGFAAACDGVDDGPRPEFDRGALARAVLAAYRERGLVARSLGAALATGTVRREVWVKD